MKSKQQKDTNKQLIDPGVAPGLIWTDNEVRGQPLCLKNALPSLCIVQAKPDVAPESYKLILPNVPTFILNSDAFITRVQWVMKFCMFLKELKCMINLLFYLLTTHLEEVT